MISQKYLKRTFVAFLALTFLFFAGLLYVFLHSYYLCSYKTVKSFRDPRWRIFDFNSRQASEGEIYNVADVPALKDTRLIGNRKLRFEFSLPIKAKSWEILSASDRSVISQGRYPEIQFPDDPLDETFIFVPEGVTLPAEISIFMHFWPKENFKKEGLSWPDNYWIEKISIPVSIKPLYSVDEWAGLPDTDPDIIEARRILGNTIDMNAPTLTKVEQVYRFVMENMNFAHETPSDEVQDASPLVTYRLLNSGKGKGWCENHAIVYYLFANAAGIKTRLIDLAGKLGPLKLTGHYFCESWIPEQSTWCYVDPESYTAYTYNSQGHPLNTLDLKKLIDLDVFEGITALTYDLDSSTYITKSNAEARDHLKENWLHILLDGDVVLGYKFGYSNNKSFSKIKNFLGYTTLLYAPFALPKLHRVKYTFLYGFIISMVLSALVGLVLVFVKRQ